MFALQNLRILCYYHISFARKFSLIRQPLATDSCIVICLNVTYFAFIFCYKNQKNHWCILYLLKYHRSLFLSANLPTYLLTRWHVGTATLYSTLKWVVGTFALRRAVLLANHSSLLVWFSILYLFSFAKKKLYLFYILIRRLDFLQVMIFEFILMESEKEDQYWICFEKLTFKQWIWKNIGGKYHIY
jgi:hypothetical protein